MPQYQRKGKNTYVAKWSGRIVATAVVNDADNYVQSLYVKPEARRKGIATELVRFIGEDRGKKLNRAPDHTKNDAIRALSAKMTDELLDEAP